MMGLRRRWVAALAVLATLWVACSNRRPPRQYLGDDCGREGEACCKEGPCYPGLKCSFGACEYDAPPPKPTSSASSPGPATTPTYPPPPPPPPPAKVAAITCGNTQCPGAITCQYKTGARVVNTFKGCCAQHQQGATCLIIQPGMGMCTHMSKEPIQEDCVPSSKTISCMGGKLTCPALWIFRGKVLGGSVTQSSYKHGCCGISSGVPYCGAGYADGCEDVKGGNEYISPAP